MLEFADSVSQLEKWEKGRALLVYGADNTFCSGGDLDLMKALLEEPEGGARMSAFMHDTLLRYHIFIYWLGESTCSCIEEARPILEGQNLTFMPMKSYFT